MCNGLSSSPMINEMMMMVKIGGISPAPIEWKFKRDLSNGRLIHIISSEV